VSVAAPVDGAKKLKSRLMKWCALCYYCKRDNNKKCKEMCEKLNKHEHQTNKKHVNHRPLVVGCGRWDAVPSASAVVLVQETSPVYLS
jgi:hypothetical protein